MQLHATPARKASVFGVFLWLSCKSCLCWVVRINAKTLRTRGLGASIARIVFFAEAHGSSVKVVYIAMLEAGISITVVNLPSLYYLFAAVPPGHVAHSLHSIRSNSNTSPQEKAIV
jgi:hypothetical protein